MPIDLEPAWVRSPVRAWLQRHVEARLLERLGGRLDGGRALEIGCGGGVGVQVVLERFGARHVQAFDNDPAAVAAAHRRLAAVPRHRLRLGVGDATAIDAPDASVDGVFCFAVLHHVDDWRAAVAEVGRVLRPGGRFFFDEVTDRALEAWVLRRFTRHPVHDRFSGEQLVAELRRHGIDVGDRVRHGLGGRVVLGVGHRVTGRDPRCR
ncbi:N/A [soil metagenome]